LRPIFECLIEVDYAEPYKPEPTIREYLENPTQYRIKKITFSAVSNYVWVYSFSRIIEAYQTAKEEFHKYQKPTTGEDLKEYEAVKKFFDEH
jgi:predicted transcriptional regulator